MTFFVFDTADAMLQEMAHYPLNDMPTKCPSCQSPLAVTRMTCSSCATEVNGVFNLGRLAALAEPHASLLEMFLRVRGNVKDMERLLGLSYPTVRARLEEALEAAGLDKEPVPAISEAELRHRRQLVLDKIQRGEISASDAAADLRALQEERGA
jgi:hypothetical protein